MIGLVEIGMNEIEGMEGMPYVYPKMLGKREEMGGGVKEGDFRGLGFLGGKIV